MPELDNKGVIPLPLLIAAVAIIGFIGITSVAPVREGLLGALYGKSSSFAATGTINVDPSKTYQTFTGWEATAQTSSFVENDTLGVSKVNSVYPVYKDYLFDQAVNNLGINRLRLEVNPVLENNTDYFAQYINGQINWTNQWQCYRGSSVNDNSDPNSINQSGFKWTYLDYKIDNIVLPMRQKLQARGEKLFINVNYVGFNKFSNTACAGVAPGLTNVLNTNAQEYAEFVLATYQHMQSKYGFTPDSWEVSLEPDIISMDGTLMGNMIVASAAKLTANGFTPNFVVPSTTSMTNASIWFDQIKAVPGALQHISEISYHRYQGVSDTALQSIATRATQNNKNTSMLEWIGADYTTLHKDLTLGRNSAWQQYTLAYGTTNPPNLNAPGSYFALGLSNTTASQIVNMTNLTKFLRQYFKFIRAGALRIDAQTTDANFDPVAFINTDGKYVVVVKASAGGNFTVGNLPGGTYGIKFTTASQYDIDQADQAINTGSLLSTNIPAAGAITIYQKTAGSTTDVTSKIENLGNPTKTRWADGNECVYARNVWDLQGFGGKLYIGSGNSSNNPPCGNAGPSNVIAYDPTSNTFATEYTADSEQIDKYIILNGQLVVPSHDPRGPNELAFFRKDPTSWTKQIGVSTELVVHTYDLASFANTLFASVGSAYTTVYSSKDGGINWNAGNSSILDRGYSLFTFAGKLYLAEDFWSSSNPPASLYEYTSGSSFTPFPSIQFSQMFPGIPVAGNGKIHKPTNYLSQLVYIGATVVNDHQGDPFGLFKASTINSSGINASKIDLPGNAKPWDILVGVDGKLYVLGSIQNGSRYWVTVSSTSDLSTWTEEFRFDAATYARSFEQLNGDWYFGLGTDTTPLSNATGDILRIKATASASPSPIKTGDLDSNNKVDIFDYNILLTDFGKTGNFPADLDKSGKVDIFDYNILLTNFGT